MSLAELRSLLLGASLTQGPVADFARVALTTWGEQGERRRPLTNAQKCARRRLRKQGIDPDAPPLRDTSATPSDTAETPTTSASGVAVLSVVPSPLSSSPSPSLSEPLFPDGSGGSTGAREGHARTVVTGAGGGYQNGHAAVEHGVRDTAATPATPSKVSRSRGDRGTRLPEDWKPAPATLRALAEELGVDPRPAILEFRDFWTGVPGVRGLKTNWDGTFRNRVRALAGDGKLPALPPAPAAPPLRGDPGQALRVSDLVNGIGVPAILAAKEGPKHG